MTQPQLRRPSRSHSEDSQGQRAIHTAGLCKSYGDTVALDDLNLTVNDGEVYGYLGPNGAGKTTTIRLLLGLHRPSAGHAELFGLDAWSEPVTAHRRVAYVAGEPFLWPSLTSAETFEFLARLRDGTDVAYRDVLIERFQLDVDKKIRALSKGNRQKVQLIAAFACRADLLLLDEPTAGLDPLMEVAFRETVMEAKQRGQSDLPLLPHPQRGRGAMRPRRDPQRRKARRRGNARRAAPPRGADRRRHVHRPRARAARRWPESTYRAPARTRCDSRSQGASAR